MEPRVDSSSLDHSMARPSLERYTVEVEASPSYQLLVPASPDSSVADFLNIVIARFRKHTNLSDDHTVFSIHLRSFDGPLLDMGDKLSEVVFNPQTEFMYLKISGQTSSKPAEKTPASDQYFHGFRVRLLTPKRARDSKLHEGYRDVPAEPRMFTGSDTLSDIKTVVTAALGKIQPSPATAIVDMFTSETAISTLDLTQTISKVGLHELVIDGVLNIYAVRRRGDGASSQTTFPSRTAMFSAGLHWQCEIEQTRRGIAAYLSTLRVFSHLTSSHKMKAEQQEAVLQVVHALFNFPPTLAAFRSLMDGKTIQKSESAALIQCCFFALSNMIPPALIKHRSSATLEGSRLLFGFILDRATQIQFDDEHPRPFLKSYRAVELRTFTGHLLKNPVLTTAGLMNQEEFNKSPTAEAMDMENSLIPRLVFLSGGRTEVKFFDHDELLKDLMSSESTAAYTISVTQDLRHLATLCDLNNLHVTNPASLAKSLYPCLTLDKEGHLAVYLGRTACGAPPNDFEIFRPLLRNVESADPSLIEQKILPMLKARRMDGTIVFDLFGTVNGRSIESPTELLMVCVDRSKSMSSHSGFGEAVHSEQDDFMSEGHFDEGTNACVPYLFSQVTKWLSDLDYFKDLLAIIKTADEDDRECAAMDIIETLVKFSEREIVHIRSSIRTFMHTTTRAHVQRFVEPLEAQLRKELPILYGLKLHHSAARQYLCHRADETFPSTPGDWVWYPDQNVPTMQRKQSLEGLFPEGLYCPLGGSIFKDPVRAADGHVYERDSIRKWFSHGLRSPVNGVSLSDSCVEPDVMISQRVDAWINAEDIIASVGDTCRPAKKTRTKQDTPSSSGWKIGFLSPVGHFSRVLPPSMTQKDLHEVVRRGVADKMLPREFQKCHFELRYQNVQIPATSSPIRDLNLEHDCTILVESTRTAAENHPVNDPCTEMSLVKLWHGKQKFAFGYWVATNSRQTFASALIKYWLWQCEQESFYPSVAFDSVIWTKLRCVGDDTHVGNRKDSWESLTSNLNAQDAIGCLDAEEPLCTKSKRGHGDPWVLKLVVWPYESGDDIKRRMEREARQMSRLDVTKQLFGAMLNRIIAYQFSIHLGVVGFDSTCEVLNGLSGVLEDFRDSVTKIESKKRVQMLLSREAPV